MKRRHWWLRGLALSAALALCVPAACLAEEAPAAEPDSQVMSAEEEMSLENESYEAPAADVEEALPEPTQADADPAEPGAETASEGGDASGAGEPGADPAEAPQDETGAEPDPALAEAEAGDQAGADIASQETAWQEEAQVAKSQSEPSVRLGVGEQYSVDGPALLNGASVALYRSDRPDVAAVDAQTGLVTALAKGTAVITVTGADGATGSCGIAVLNAPESLSFEFSSLNLGKGERRTLAAVLPADTASWSITYASSKSSVVSVDAAGNIRAKKAGTATIAAMAFNGAKAVCKVKVLEAPSKLTLSATKLVLNVGAQQALKVKLPKKTASAITWASSDPNVVSVNASGVVQGVSAGSAVVKAAVFTGKSASCKVVVLAGGAPTRLTLEPASLALGVKEKYQLSPAVGEGEEAIYAYSSSKPTVASVNSKGVITAKKAGTAKITVATHNGLKAKVTVKVGKAPNKVTMSQAEMALEAGTAAQLSAWLPSGMASSIRWDSSNTGVATVDANGIVTGVSAGTAAIRARTFNNKSAICQVTVTPAGVTPETTPEPTPTPDAPLTASRMVSNLRSSGALGAKSDAICNVIGLLIDSGFEPAFAAGVGANIYSEGTYGLFESSKYITNYKSRPRYFCYLDGGDYYSSGKLTAVYMCKEEIADYMGGPEARERFGPKNFYLDNYSGKFVWDVDLNELEALMEKLAEGGWEGKFGLGIVQWTGGRTKTLVSFYRKAAGPDATKITRAQAIAAENQMIISDLKGGYSGVYSSWKNANSDGGLYTEEAAYSAGSIVCLRYEIPANKESKAVTRGNKAAEIFRIMVGGD